MCAWYLVLRNVHICQKPVKRARIGLLLSQMAFIECKSGKQRVMSSFTFTIPNCSTNFVAHLSPPSIAITALFFFSLVLVVTVFELSEYYVEFVVI